MSKLYLGKIDVSKIDKTKLFQGKKGVWADVTIWIDDQPTEDWKACSIQQSTPMGEDKIYLGNAKLKELEPHDITGEHEQNETTAEQPIDDLPF